MTANWSTVWEVALLALGGTALWLFIGLGWHGLHRAPRRPRSFSPLIGGAMLIAMIIAGQAGMLIATNVFGIQMQPPEGEAMSLPDMARLLLGTVAGQGIVLLAYIHLLSQARKPLDDNRMKPATAVAFGVGALLLFWPMVNALGWLASRTVAMVTGEPIDPVAHDTLAMIVTSERDAWFALMVLLVVVAIPILEEVLYRGILQETLGNLGMGNWTAILVTSAIFAVMHATVVPLWALGTLFALSLGFGWAYEKTGRLTAPIVMHMLFNGGNVLLAILVA